jgi:Ribosomal RNA adenine dimethylase
MKQKEDQSKEKIIAREQSYSSALVDELRPSGDVLEIGFGLGYIAQKIQNYQPKSYTVIEHNPQIAKEAKAWASQQKNVLVIEDSWQAVLPKLKVFDSIFYNNDSDSNLEALKNLSPKEVKQTANQAKEMLTLLEKQFSQLNKQFSDQEINNFYEKIGQFNLHELPEFFKTLKDKGCISDKQYEQVLKKYTAADKRAPRHQTADQTLDPMLSFLEESLEKHMRKGSRFSSFLRETTSKYDDPHFFERIIENPKLQYTEKLISVEVAKDQPSESLLIMTVEKLA